MPTTVGTYTLTYPANNTDGSWYSTFASLAQEITDHLDTITGLVELVNDTDPTLIANFDMNNFDFIDANGNEIIEFTATPLAVNYIDIANASISTGPTIVAAGTDTNIELDVAGKGTGKVAFISDLKLADSLNVNTQSLVDSNGNEVLGFTQTASAINYVTIDNSTTTNGPQIEVAGDDTNIDLELGAKGTGKIICNSTLELDADITLNANNSYDLGDSTNSFRNAYLDRFTFNGTAAFNENSVYKAWVTYKQATSPSIKDSYNVSSVTDNGSGSWTVNFTTNFDNLDFLPIGSMASNGDTDNRLTMVCFDQNINKTVSYCGMTTVYANSTTDRTLFDRDRNFVAFVGDRG